MSIIEKFFIYYIKKHFRLFLKIAPLCEKQNRLIFKNGLIISGFLLYLDMFGKVFWLRIKFGNTTTQVDALLCLKSYESDIDKFTPKWLQQVCIFDLKPIRSEIAKFWTLFMIQRHMGKLIQKSGHFHNLLSVDG